MEYELMSDDELSSELMAAVYGEQVNHWCLSECGKYVYDCGPLGDQFYRADIIDINSWADMGPIIEYKKVGVYPMKGGGWMADGYSLMIGINSKDDKPLRAAAIVILKMRDAEYGNS